MPAPKHPEATKHMAIDQLFENVFWVHGSVKLAPGMCMNRNMLIVREGNDLNLINPVRLSQEEESRLLELGVVKRIFRLGDFHGMDDAYYLHTFNCEFWCPKGVSTYTEPEPTHILDQNTQSPINNSQLFSFSNALYPEWALLLNDHKLLITTDAIQNHTNWKFTNFPARSLLKLMGFGLRPIIGKPWLKRVTPKGDSMKKDFEALCTLDFDHLIAAHGSLLKDDAKQAVNKLVRITF